MNLPLPTTLLVATDITSMVPATRKSTGAPRVFTRGRLSLLTSPLLPTTLLEDTVTTSMAPATLMSTGAPRVSTRGRLMPLSLLTSLLLPTTLLVVMDTTSMAPAILMSTGAPRNCTRGMPLAPALRLSTAPTATGTTARTPNTGSRSTAMRPTSTRTVTDTEALLGHAKEHENVPVVIL